MWGKCLDCIFSLNQTSARFYQYDCFTFRLFPLVNHQQKVYAGVNFGKIIGRSDGDSKWIETNNRHKIIGVNRKQSEK